MSKVWSILLVVVLLVLLGLGITVWLNKSEESETLHTEPVDLQVDYTVSSNTEEVTTYPKGENGPEDTGPEPTPDPVDGVEVWDVMSIRQEMQKHIEEIADYTKRTYPGHTSITCSTYTDTEYTFRVDGTDLKFLVIYDEMYDEITFEEIPPTSSVSTNE